MQSDRSGEYGPIVSIVVGSFPSTTRKM